MNLIINPSYTTLEAHNSLFGGDFIVYTEIQSVKKLVTHARSHINSAFGSLDPETAQHNIPVEEFISIASKLKTEFTNSILTKDIIRSIIKELSYDISDTYFDVPRLRIVTSNNYLSSGIGYAYKAHRDTWYSSPEQQINLWLPVYDTTPENGIKFYPDFWNRSIKNSSSEFFYDEWQIEGRKLAIHQVYKDTRNHPLPLENLSSSLSFVYSGKAANTLQFSASQLHETLVNTSGKTRFSIDFRIISGNDLRKGLGAPNLDNNSKGTTLGDFFNALDFSKIDNSITSTFNKYQKRKPNV